MFACDSNLCSDARAVWSLPLRLTALVFPPQTYGSLQDVLVSFGRRLLCYPLYRHFSLASAAVRDVATILQSGELQTDPVPPPSTHTNTHTHIAAVPLHRSVWVGGGGAKSP